MRRFRWLLAFVPIAVLLVWLVVTQLPTWSAPNSDWFPVEMPGQCAAVASLKANGGTLAGVPSLNIDAARNAGQDTINFALDGVSGWVYGEPVAVRANFDAGSRPAWLMTGRAESGGVAPVVVVYIDGETGSTLSVITGLDDPAALCEFNLRRAARDTISSPPFIILRTYVVLLIVYVISRLVVRRSQSARKG